MTTVTDGGTSSVAVIIVAGGKGSRMGGNENKLFLPLGDSCILGETLRVWQGISQVGQIVVVCADGEREIVSNLCRKQQITKAVLPVIGGKELIYAARGIITRTYESMFPLLGTAMIYLVMVLIFSWLQGKLEKKLRQSDRR